MGELEDKIIALEKKLARHEALGLSTRLLIDESDSSRIIDAVALTAATSDPAILTSRPSP